MSNSNHSVNIGKASKALVQFINDILEEKFIGLPDTAGTIYKKRDFRLDMQNASNLRLYG